ncbi:MAG: helix-turn-helix transcriptional regulator [bacterium]|nr:helix-turn-helix transcriptional regulator [Candidatus Limimorpha caballi]MCQ2316415.1 helix-turn-helix domain-containing protein [Bacteroidales bacterium]
MNDKINIGELIDMRRKELGLSIRDFAARISVSSGNAYDILKRESIDVALLQRVSAALDYDFFKHLTTDEGDDGEEYVYIMVKVSRKALVNGDVCSGCKYRFRSRK